MGKDKVTDIRDKKTKKPLSPKEAAERAYREHFQKTPVENEPEDLASGKVTEDGKMIVDEDDKDER